MKRQKEDEMPKTTKEIIEETLYNTKINWIPYKPDDKLLKQKWYSEEEVDKIIEQCLNIKIHTEDFKNTEIIGCPICGKKFIK